MSQFEKLLEKFLANPTSLKATDIVKILLKFGFTKREAKGSHTKYTKGDKYVIFPIHNGDCKGIYKKDAKKCIKEIIQEESKAE